MAILLVIFLTNVLSALFVVFLAALFAIIVYLIFTSIMESISIMCIYKNSGYSKYPTAWIPFYNKYLLARIIDKQPLGIALALCNILIVTLGCYLYIYGVFISILFAIFLVLCLISFILNTVIYHKILKATIPKLADILTLVNIFTLGFLRPVFLFLLRNTISV